jgi:NAD dependent epimerase/dehydratase
MTLDLKNKRVLVTGADGFIGSHLVEMLVQRGSTVRAFVMYNSMNSWGWLDHVPAETREQLDVVAGDIRDSERVQQAVNGCDVVMHLAALISIPYSYVSARSYVDTNISGTLNVMEAARNAKVSRVVHTSTSEVYGSAQFVPITEEHPLQGQSPYSASKIAADQLALSFHTSFGTPVSVIRPFNTYGPRQSARAVIPTIILQIANGCKSLKLGALHPTRDFNYIEDTVSGFIAVAESDASVGEVINIGSSHEVSIGDTARLIAEVMGRSVDIMEDETRIRPEKSEVVRLCASNEKARNLTGWQPEYAGLDGLRKGIEKTANWFLEPRHAAFYKGDLYNI